MSLSMYEASVPTLSRMLDNLRGILSKGAAHAEQHKLDPAALTTFRLYPDMFPLTRQVQIATDMAKGCVARLAGVEPPAYEDKETTFAELGERVEKTAAFVKSFSSSQIDGSEDREIVLKMRNGEMRFSGKQYLLHFAIPNVHFHVATAYLILRHNGVVLGKPDFIGAN
ncbi:MAG: hypothetical protein JWQ90_1005 [Hydrocarboniphaga sp.]|uniref:DUF1993 domain-containing protein n=1 Tax=Hydrocarboniphaga sp. TaxID=2033016 RepID=UPI00260F94C7|nr:DUF1993 domain-containing protein [Hydrocarboniphaga sp.]MDB5968555.1 hypothetical protein [Hydrocarboniphaga sp.]